MPATFTPSVPQTPAEAFAPGPGDTAAGVQAAPATLDAGGEEGGGLSLAYRASLDVDTTARAKANGLVLKDMRNARRGLRKLAQAVGSSDESEWEGIITAAIVAEPAILSYVGSVTAYAAFAETKAEPALVERVIAALRASELVPDGAIPYTEEDYAAMMAGEGE
jgi:hypothetical protein